MPSKQRSTSCNIGLKNDNSEELVFDCKIVAEKFNSFFCNIASKLVEKLPKRQFEEQKIVDLYKDKIQSDRFKFNVVSDDEVFKLLKDINVSKSTGCDGIAAVFIRDGANVLSCPVTYIVNLSLSKGIVPNDFKLARVVPLYKKGDKKFEGNYRPVSILPVFSKVFERIVYNQMYKYLMDHNLIFENQSGFRSRYSTDTALTSLADRIKQNTDNGLYTGMVLLDLQKAFDTVDHKILLSKLKAVGSEQGVVTWFDSYLSGRNQVVDVNGIMSSPHKVTCGVPQGSILGPLLFILYVNDMYSAVTCELILYADDSALIVSGDDVEEIQTVLRNELMNVSKWLEANKLSLHLGKTESILFGSKSHLKKTDKMEIVCNGNEIKAMESVKYLGARLDQELSGNEMGLSVIKRVNKCLKFLYRKADYFSTKERKMLCQSLCQPHFDYACNVWYRSMGKGLKNKLQTAQNKLIRYVLQYDSRQHLEYDDFVKVKYLSVEKRVDYLNICMMYKIYHGEAPSYMCNLARVTHNHATRNSTMSFIVPQVKSQGLKSFSYNGIKLWNSIPSYIRKICSKEDFKFKCKKHMFNLMRLENQSEFTV